MSSEGQMGRAESRRGEEEFAQPQTEVPEQSSEVTQLENTLTQLRAKVREGAVLKGKITDPRMREIADKAEDASLDEIERLEEEIKLKKAA